ncbi:hypothetical protein [Micromonospora chersina]|uniref:hypothetical protein n=1 Tax=Micromonospora chersina TaxID=47854 RepID=UPI0033EACC8D
MTRSWRRPLLAAALSLTAGIAGLLVSTPAQADTPETWSFNVVGEPGDIITGGGSYSYSSTEPVPGEEMNAWGTEDRRSFGLELFGELDNVWRLSLAGPAGEVLKPGDTYQNVGHPIDDGPGISFYNNSWRGCAESTGSFTVLDVAWAPTATWSGSTRRSSTGAKGPPEAPTARSTSGTRRRCPRSTRPSR